jgi:hypothetical protein
MNEPNPLDGATPEQLALLKEKLNIGTTPEQLAREGDSPEPVRDPEPVRETERTPDPIDWSDFDLDPQIAHLYAKAQLQDTLEGPRVVCPIDLFEFETAPYSQLGAIVTRRVNGGGGWKIVSVYGNGAGMGVVLFNRTAPHLLPMPSRLRTEAELPPLQTNEELAETEQLSFDWIAREGQAVEAESVLIPTSQTVEPFDVTASANSGSAGVAVAVTPDG